MKKKLSALICVSALFATNVFANEPAAQHGMVVSEQAYASQVGLAILQAGGNAVDAAVAVGYALAVVNPCCGNIGGGGFMTLHLANGKNSFFNFRETAPLAATANMFLDQQGHVIPKASTQGYLAVAVPGTVLGFEKILQKYGTLSRQRVLAPAIELAEKGYVLSAGDAKLFNNDLTNLQQAPNVSAIFLKNNQPYLVGERLTQQNLAKSLKLISQQGSKVFYQGSIAAAIVAASQKNNGILTLKDFAKYRVQELTPIQCTYRGYTIITAPPPSSGGTTLCEMLNILENYPLKSLAYHSVPSIHYIVEAMRRAYFDRNNDLGDPDFVKNPVARLISKSYAAQLRRGIQEFNATPSTQFTAQSAVHEGVNTTHYSIVDKWGNAVAVTYTLNSFFGANVMAGETGFFLNNEMDDFTVKPGEKNQFGLVQGIKNGIQPGKRPLSSMTPTIVLKDNRVVMVVGSPGGPRIITATLLTILNVIDYGMSIQDAVDAARYHHQWLPDAIDIEPDVFPVSTMTKLGARGYRFAPRQPWGAVEAIYIDPKSHLIYGGSDRRRAAGKASGY